MITCDAKENHPGRSLLTVLATELPSCIHRERLGSTLPELVRMPSGNRPTLGNSAPYIFQVFGAPTATSGLHGGNTHMPDDYAEPDSFLKSTRALLTFRAWCGEADRGEVTQ